MHTDVTKYLEFKGVDGSFVQNKGRVEKVPATDYEALRSPLLGLFEKRRLRNFLLYVRGKCIPFQMITVSSKLTAPLRTQCMLSCDCVGAGSCRSTMRAIPRPRRGMTYGECPWQPCTRNMAWIP